MTDARQRSFWHRTGLVVGASAMVLAAATTEGCSSDPETTTTTTTTTSSSAVSSTSGSGGAGGGGETGGSGGGSAVFEAKAACNGESFNTPFDATPDPEGQNIYFTALDPAGKPGVFKGPAGGGGPCAPIHAGDPFVAPFNLAISTDSKTVYVADQGSDEANDAGLIFTLATAGGAPAVLTGTEGMKPRGLDTLKAQNGDILYFTGKDKATGAVGVFTWGDGKLTTVASGAPFVDPSGIAVTGQGVSYVCDTIGTPAGRANIIVVDQQGMASAYVSDLRVSYPCGVALSANEQTLLVSGLDPLTETDAIIKISLELKTVEYLTKDINIFTEAAGMHRAKSAKNLAWVDSKANKTGTVFNVTVE